MQIIKPLASSYRDPSGFMFEKNGILYRHVNEVFKNDFDQFISSGCYQHFIKNKWLIPHEEVDENLSQMPGWYKTLKPEKIPFISYPYEWSFNMLKDAAMLTLQLAKDSVDFGLIIKDASAYNIQWLQGRPIFIDTLSFEKYDPEKPWIAYHQFCKSFLSPLLLMHYSGQPLAPLLLTYPEGIPLSITSSLLPWKSRLSVHTYLHIHLHANLHSKPANDSDKREHKFSKKKLLSLVDSLQSIIQSLQWKGNTTTWEHYYLEAEQRKDYLSIKKNIVEKWINELPEIKTAIDLGANQGAFSFLLSQKNIFTLATDFDHSAINILYLKIKKDKEQNILPLVIDLSNPSPSTGVNNRERPSFLERSRADICLALALLHHLCIGKNIPFENIVSLFRSMGKYLIVEFIPKEDEKIALMLNRKKDIYTWYTEENFLSAFLASYKLITSIVIGSSNRTLYLMEGYEN